MSKQIEVPGKEKFDEFLHALRDLYGKEFVDWYEVGREWHIYIRAGVCEATGKHPAVIHILFGSRGGWHPQVVTFSTPFFAVLFQHYPETRVGFSPMRTLNEQADERRSTQESTTEKAQGEPSED